MLARLELLLSVALKRLGAYLLRGSAFLSEQSISSRCSSQASSVFFFLSSRYYAQSELTQSFLAIFGIFFSLLLLVFLLTSLATLIIGTDPVLDVVPLPWHTYDHRTDDQSDCFIDADVAPLLQRNPDASSLHCINPATGASLGHVRMDTVHTVTSKIAHARKAQSAWAQTSFAERRKVLRVLKEYLLWQQIPISGISAADTGKTLLDAALGEILTTLEKIRWILSEGEAALSEQVRSTGPLAKHKSARLSYSPLGVICAIAPWNYPVHNFFNPVISALFSGNAIIVKPSEHTAYTSVYIARIVRRALSLCGHSPELVQVAIGAGDIGSALVQADVDKIFFTGSTVIGRKVATAAAQRLKPVVLELGGKDAFIVCEDADLKHALSLCLRGVFQNAGQNCIGVERVFVHKSVKNRFVEMAVDTVREMRLGIDVGAQTLGVDALGRLETVLEEAVAEGAAVRAGGKRTSLDGKGTYFQPTVVDNVTMKMRMAQEELFAPIMSIFEWDTDDQVIELVNQSEFGLSSSVFSGNSRRAEKILNGLQVGMGNINDFGINYLCQSLPFGGTKMSGSDRFAGVEGLRGCCLMKSTTRDKFPFVKTILPANLKYPVSENAFALAAEINELVYCKGIIDKIDHLRNVLVELVFRSWMPRTVRADIDNVR